jgi:hypothetical protein
VLGVYELARRTIGQDTKYRRSKGPSPLEFSSGTLTPNGFCQSQRQYGLLALIANQSRRVQMVDIVLGMTLSCQAALHFFNCLIKSQDTT